MTQIWVWFWLRYRLFVGGLRRQNPQAAFLIAGFLLLMSAFSGVIFFIALVQGFLPQKIAVFPVSFWLLTWLQLVLSVTGQTTGTAVSITPRPFLLLPLSLSKLFWLSAVTVYADFACWFLLPSLSALILAPTVYYHQPWGLVILLLALLWLGVVSLTLNVVITRFGQGTGRKRETLVAIGIGIILIVPQLVLLVSQKFPGWGKWISQSIDPYLVYLPPQALAQASLALETGKIAPLGWAVWLVMGWSAGALSLSYTWFRQLALQTEGVPQTERQPTVSATNYDWILTGINGAIMTKHLKYLGRNPLSYFALLPLLLLFFAAGLLALKAGIWANVGLWLAVGNVYLLAVPWFTNLFGWDNTGFKTYLLAPTPWHTILRAHNLAQGLWTAVPALLGVGITVILEHLPLAAGWCGVVAIGVFGLIYSVLGNWFSVRFPLPRQFGFQARQGSNTWIALLAVVLALGINLVATLPVVLLTVSILIFKNYILFNSGLLLLLGSTFLAYHLALPAQAIALAQRQDQILTRLTE